MTDYRRFLGATQQSVLPYFGGPFVAAEDRRLRIAAPVEPGFWHFEITGRTARATGPADPPDLSRLRAVRGHFTDGYVVHRRAERLALPPAEQPPRFAPLLARRWPTGELLPDLPEFEGEAEEAARQAFEERRPLGAVKGAPASLRAAFGYAVVLRTAREQGVRVAPAEVRGRVGELADGGDARAVEVLRDVVAERARRTSELRVRTGAPGRTRDPRRPADPAERAAEALAVAGATLLDLRELRDGLIEVRYQFLGERFVTVARADTLQVLDAGICLAGADRELTLESLPAVLREAMDRGDLYITAYG